MTQSDLMDILKKCMRTGEHCLFDLNDNAYCNLLYVPDNGQRQSVTCPMQSFRIINIPKQGIPDFYYLPHYRCNRPNLSEKMIKRGIELIQIKQYKYNNNE